MADLETLTVHIKGNTEHLEQAFGRVNAQLERMIELLEEVGEKSRAIKPIYSLDGSE